MRLLNIFNKKCPQCQEPMTEHVAEITLRCEDGEFKVEVCSECSRFWDLSTDIIQKNGKNKNA
jgi:primosomal protein N'